MKKANSILHVDMDSFFVSVELLERPELLGLPVVVAHEGARSVVSSASYEARRYGISSAQPLELARRRCPRLVVLEPNFFKYRALSQAVMRIFYDFTPRVEPLSIDEAFLDVTGAKRLFGSPREIAVLLRSRIKAKTGLAASVGISPVKFIAKIASNRAKPDGIFEVSADETIPFLHSLGIEEMWGVGAVTSKKLRSRGIRTVEDLSLEPLDSLREYLGEALALKLHDLAHGRDEREVESARLVKSIGHEETFGVDQTDRASLERVLLQLSAQTAERLRRKSLEARTVAIKLRWSNFETITRTRTLPTSTQSTQKFYATAKQLLRENWSDRRAVRLLGVRAEQLIEGGENNPLLWDDDESWSAVDQTVDKVSDKFGNAGLQPARLLRSPHHDSG